jgi:hypothetical protein
VALPAAARQAEMAVGLETDTPDMLNEMIKAVRKGGRISVVGEQADGLAGLGKTEPLCCSAGCACRRCRSPIERMIFLSTRHGGEPCVTGFCSTFTNIFVFVYSAEIRRHGCLYILSAVNMQQKPS